jgi:hypothetical protein
MSQLLVCPKDYHEPNNEPPEVTLISSRKDSDLVLEFEKNALKLDKDVRFWEEMEVPLIYREGSGPSCEVDGMCRYCRGISSSTC